MAIMKYAKRKIMYSCGMFYVSIPLAVAQFWTQKLPATHIEVTYDSEKEEITLHPIYPKGKHPI